MATERQPELPANMVPKNRYMSDSQRRVRPKKVQENQWYIARLIDFESRSISRYAKDVLLRVVRVEQLKNGSVKVYATNPNTDGAEEVDESDALPVDRNGYLVDEDDELGYLLEIFRRRPKRLGELAAATAL